MHANDRENLTLSLPGFSGQAEHRFTVEACALEGSPTLLGVLIAGVCNVSASSCTRTSPKA
jgi:hypothetical protein